MNFNTIQYLSTWNMTQTKGKDRLTKKAIFHFAFVSVTWFLVIILYPLTSISNETNIFNVEDYGATPNSGIDSGPAIRTAISHAIASGPGAEVHFGPGTFHVGAGDPGNFVFLIDQAENLSIIGSGESTEIIVTTPDVHCFLIGDSSEVLLKDFVIDYDPPPFTQGTITAVNNTNKTFNFEIDPSFPNLDEPWFDEIIVRGDSWGMLYDKNARRLKARVADHFFISSSTKIGEMVYRLQVASNNHYKFGDIEVDDRFVLLARRTRMALLFSCTDGGGVSNLTIHSSPNFAVCLWQCKNISIDGLKVTYRSETQRLITTDGDGVHSLNNRVGPSIRNSLFEGLADDAIAVYGLPYIITQVDSPTQVCTKPLAEEPASNNEILPGDRLQIFNPREGKIVGEVVTSNVVESTGTNCMFHITFNTPVSGIIAGDTFENADVIYNASDSGEGTEIIGNEFRNHRANGVDLCSGQTIIENNTFTDLGMTGVIIWNFIVFYEGPIPQSVIVRNNLFENIGRSEHIDYPWKGSAIHIQGTKLYQDTDLADERIVRDILVEDNVIKSSSFAAVYVGSAKNVTIKNNHIEANDIDQPHTTGGAVILENAEAVQIQNLTIDDPRPETTAAIEIYDSVLPGEQGVVIDGINANLYPGSVKILDHRTPLYKPIGPGIVLLLLGD